MQDETATDQTPVTHTPPRAACEYGQPAPPVNYGEAVQEIAKAIKSFCDAGMPATHAGELAVRLYCATR